MIARVSALPLPAWIEARLDDTARHLLQPPTGPQFDFSKPSGETALVGPDSVSWQVFKNPLALFVGGVAAVILELAEPSVRTGVWEHSSFRTDPMTRLQRTGLAAMVTVYGAKSQAKAMIAGVVQAHAKVKGQTPAGTQYRANDVRLLNWVQTTAAFGFSHAYDQYVQPMTTDDVDHFMAEGAASAKLYGARGAPSNAAEMAHAIEAMRGRLEASPIVFEFLGIVSKSPLLPGPLRFMQAMLVKAAVDLMPPWVREVLGLTPAYGLAPWERSLVCRAGRMADRLMLPSSPAVQSCLRLGLAPDHLFASKSKSSARR